MDNKKGIIYTALSKRKITVVIVFILFVGGIMSYISLPKQEYPVVEIPMVIITTVYPGASAEDMEELVSEKIEDKCMASDYFYNVTSNSYNSTSVVKVMFEKDISDSELKRVKDDLRKEIEALRENELPSGITSLVYNDDAFRTAGMIVAFTSETENNASLIQRAEALKDRLMNIDGVQNVETEGEREQRIKITVDSAKLNHTDVSLSELATIIDYQNSGIPVGTIEFDNEEIYINSSGKLSDIDEIKDIIISINSDTGAVVKLKDVADVSYEENEDSKSYKYNSEDAVILSLYFDEGVNVLDTGKAVEGEIERYQKTLPDTVHTQNVVYLPDDVSSSINNFVVNLIESVVIVLLVVMIGMSIKNGIITSVVIPLTIFVSFIIMKVFGIDIQFVSLASLIIALGMLVDNAIVVSDAIQVRVDNGEDKFSACVNGAKEVAVAVLSSTLTTVAIFSVFYALPGTMRRFVFSLPTIVIGALVSSYVISMLVTPVMCFWLMKKSKEKKAERVSLVRKFFSALLRLALRFKLITLFICVVAIVCSAFLLFSRSLELVPPSDKTLLDITITTDNFYDIRKTKNAVTKAEQVLKNHPEVKYYLSSSGGRIPKYEYTTMPGTDATNTGNIVARIDLSESDMTKTEFAEALSNELSGQISGMKVIVKEIGIIPKSSEPIQVNICGDDFDKLNELSTKAETLLRETNAVKDVYSDKKMKTYNYYVDMKNNSLNSQGLTKAEVQNELNIAMMGREITTFRDNGKEYPVILTTDTNTIDDLNSLTIKSSITEEKSKLSQVADVSVKSEYDSISHFNGKRSVTLTCNTTEGNSPVEIQRKLMKELEGDEDEFVSFEYEGDNDMFSQLMSALIKGSVFGVLIIFLILYIQFYSLKRSIIVFISIPFSIIGASIGLTLTNQNLSFFAILGIISLIGVVVNNAIVLIDYMDSQLERGLSVYDATRTAVDMRFRPIMLSSVTTILGLIPLAFGGNILFKGLSIAFMSGLTTSLFFTLIVVPVVYCAVVKDKK
jgi:multidrug efflux pump subunit AcrB